MSLYWINNPNSFRLAIVARPRGADWLHDEVQRLKNSEVQVMVSMLTQSETEELGLTLEPEECHACGIEFLNFPMEDRGLPTNVPEFKKFVEQIAKLLGEGKSVAVHCRAGIAAHRY